MARTRLPLTQLQALEAVGRLASYKAATLELDGSNVSKHVAALEASLGIELVRSSPRGTLTPEGHILARALTRSFDEIAGLLLELGSGPLERERLLELAMKYSPPYER